MDDNDDNAPPMGNTPKIIHLFKRGAIDLEALDCGVPCLTMAVFASSAQWLYPNSGSWLKGNKNGLGEYGNPFPPKN